MARTPLQRALLAARLLFLGGSVAAGAFYWLVTREPEWVDAKRDRWVQKATWDLDEAVKRLEREADRNVDTGVPALEQFVRDLGHVRPEDRAMPYARKALAAIARIEENRGRIDAAIVAVARSLTLQPNDLPSRTLHARLLCRSPATRTEGMHRLRELITMFPEVSFIADQLATEQRADGDLLAAFETLRQLEATAPLPFWRLRVPDFPHTMELVANRRGEGMVLTFSLPAGMSSFLLEPPGYIGMRVTDATLQVENQGGKAIVSLLSVATQFVGMNRVDDTIYPLWNVHGHMRFDLPHLPPELEHTLTITAKAELAPSPAMLDLAADPRAMPLAQTRAAAGDRTLLDAILRARSAAYPLAEFDYFWADGDRFSGDHTARCLGMVQAEEGSVRFEVTAALSGDATLLRLDYPMPGSQPRQFVLQHVQVEDATGVLDIPITPKSFHAVNQMRPDGDGLIATGSDPFVVIKLPRRAAGMVRAVARGTTR